MKNGAAYAWGYNNYGQLGDGTTTERNAPVVASGLTSGVTAIAAGEAHCLAVKNGGVYAWGYNNFGQLGDGTTLNELTPERIDAADLTNIISVAAGCYSSYALSSDGSLWAWGVNELGELGLGNTNTEYLTPQHLLPPTGYIFTSIAANAAGDTVLATLAAPEPASLGFLGLGLMTLLARRRSGP